MRTWLYTEIRPKIGLGVFRYRIRWVFGIGSGMGFCPACLIGFSGFGLVGRDFSSVWWVRFYLRVAAQKAQTNNTHSRICFFIAGKQGVFCEATTRQHTTLWLEPAALPPHRPVFDHKKGPAGEI